MWDSHIFLLWNGGRSSVPNKQGHNKRRAGAQRQPPLQRGNDDLVPSAEVPLSSGARWIAQAIAKHKGRCIHAPPLLREDVKLLQRHFSLQQHGNFLQNTEATQRHSDAGGEPTVEHVYHVCGSREEQKRLWAAWASFLRPHTVSEPSEEQTPQPVKVDDAGQKNFKRRVLADAGTALLATPSSTEATLALLRYAREEPSETEVPLPPTLIKRIVTPLWVSRCASDAYSYPPELLPVFFQPPPYTVGRRDWQHIRLPSTTIQRVCFLGADARAPPSDAVARAKWEKRAPRLLPQCRRLLAATCRLLGLECVTRPELADCFLWCFGDKSLLFPPKHQPLELSDSTMEAQKNLRQKTLQVLRWARENNIPVVHSEWLWSCCADLSLPGPVRKFTRETLVPVTPFALCLMEESHAHDAESKNAHSNNTCLHNLEETSWERVPWSPSIAAKQVRPKDFVLSRQKRSEKGDRTLGQRVYSFTAVPRLLTPALLPSSANTNVPFESLTEAWWERIRWTDTQQASLYVAAFGRLTQYDQIVVLFHAWTRVVDTIYKRLRGTQDSLDVLNLNRFLVEGLPWVFSTALTQQTITRILHVFLYVQKRTGSAGCPLLRNLFAGAASSFVLFPLLAEAAVKLHRRRGTLHKECDEQRPRTPEEHYHCRCTTTVESPSGAPSVPNLDVVSTVGASETVSTVTTNETPSVLATVDDPLTVPSAALCLGHFAPDTVTGMWKLRKLCGCGLAQLGQVHNIEEHPLQPFKNLLRAKHLILIVQSAEAAWAATQELYRSISFAIDSAEQTPTSPAPSSDLRIHTLSRLLRASLLLQPDSQQQSSCSSSALQLYQSFSPPGETTSSSLGSASEPPLMQWTCHFLEMGSDWQTFFHAAGSLLERDPKPEQEYTERRLCPDFLSLFERLVLAEQFARCHRNSQDHAEYLWDAVLPESQVHGRCLQLYGVSGALKDVIQGEERLVKAGPNPRSPVRTTPDDVQQKLSQQPLQRPRAVDVQFQGLAEVQEWLTLEKKREREHRKAEAELIMRNETREFSTWPS